MTIIEDTASVLESLGFESNTLQSSPQYRALLASVKNVRIYFIWRESTETQDCVFQIARMWESETEASLGAFANVTDAIAAAKMAIAST